MNFAGFCSQGSQYYTSTNVLFDNLGMSNVSEIECSECICFRCFGERRLKFTYKYKGQLHYTIVCNDCFSERPDLRAHD